MNSWADLQKAISESPARSAWARGVRQYASELIEDCRLDFRAFVDADTLRRKAALLNGAQNWREYSEAGCSLVYNSDIAERLCTPSELKKLTLKSGLKEYPNSRESWLMCQARALQNAFALINRLLVDL